MKYICLVAALCICNLAAFSQINFFNRPASRKPALPTAAHVAQRSPQLHVVYVEEQNDLDMARVNMENDTLMATVQNLIAKGLNYQANSWRLSRKSFTSQGLKQTIDSLQTNPKDIIIVYFSGYGIPTADSTVTLANWRMNDRVDEGLPVSELEKWLGRQRAHLSFILADYKLEITKRKRDSQDVSAIVTLRPGMSITREKLTQLFIKNCGIIKLGTSIRSKYTVLDELTYSGSLFTYAFHAALLELTHPGDPSELPGLSFGDVWWKTTSYMGTMPMATVFDIQSCNSAPVSRPVAFISQANRSQAQQTSSPGANWQGYRTNEDAYSILPQKILIAKRLPSSVDLSKYTPPVVDQGNQGKCVAVAVGYYMRSTMEAIKLNLTDKEAIRKHSFSPAYLYNHVKDVNDDLCSFGLFAESALEFCQTKGLASLDMYPDLTSCNVGAIRRPNTYPDAKILDYVKLFGIIDNNNAKIQAVRQALSERSPVVVGIELTPSMGNLSFSRLFFTKLQNSVMQLVSSDSAPMASQWNPYQSNTLDFGHAMCVVGYDDKVLGGAFKLVNSWGKSWGDDGFFWITYENFARFAKYGYQAYLPTDSDPIVLSADVSLYHTLSPESPLAATPTSYNRYLTGYTLNKPLKTGSSLKLTIKTTTQSYLYVLAANSKDSTLTTLFPSGTYSPLVSANTLVDFTKDSLLTITGNPSTEYLLFIFSNVKLNNLNDIKQQLRMQQGTFPTRVVNTFTGRLIQRNKLIYKPKKTGFFYYQNPLMGDRPYIAPLLISINHVK